MNRLQPNNKVSDTPQLNLALISGTQTSTVAKLLKTILMELWCVGI